MMFQRYYQPETKSINQFANSYPVPTTLTYYYNFGVYALISLVAQLVTGMLIIPYYAADLNISFVAIENYMRDVPLGFYTRYLHANGASFFFFVVFIHLFRGVYYTSYLPPRIEVWLVGGLLFVSLCAAAFLGYVLPWGQMSFWAATVIIQLFTAIPLIGKEIVEWIWGGFTLGNTAIRRLFSLHFIVPFIIALLSLFHIYVLHRFGSNEPVGADLKISDRVNMNPYFIVKDLFGISILITIFIYFVGIMPNALGHYDNYIMADPFVTPAHIVPEWYFLWAYAILRSIPHKLLGVIGFAFSIIYIFLIPWIIAPALGRNFATRLLRFLYLLFISSIVILGLLGAAAPTPPVLLEGRLHAFIYFTILLLSNIISLSETQINRIYENFQKKNVDLSFKNLALFIKKLGKFG